LALWWFLFSVFNIAAPPSTNLAGEIFIFIGLVKWLKLSVVILSLLSFMCAAYSLFLYSATQQGSFRKNILFSYDRNCREHFILNGHLCFLIIRLWILLSLLCYCSL
jgi:NADH-ubiquinone oxidoreductase chain 4